jgi:reactive intermediate/imine deaminase
MADLRQLRVEGLPEPFSHYSDAVLAGDTLYVSGLVAINAAGVVVGEDDPVEQTRQIFRNLKLVLDAAGATPADVVKVTIFMKDVDDRAAINPVRKEFFGRHRPASTLVEVSALVLPELLLEIEAIAVVSSPSAGR